MSEFERCASDVDSFQKAVSEHIIGQEDLIVEALCSFFAGGHTLITGVPGLAKTTLVKVMAHHLGLDFGRVQFTPDLMPSDITGAEILHTGDDGKRYFEFSKGPIFANLLLADEINRASPRTQSAMLEAMQEGRVTVAGNTYPLPEPFMVLATQNPLEAEGTFPLPEAQLDRFLIHSLISYPKDRDQLSIFRSHAKNELVNLKDDSFKLGSARILEIKNAAKKVTISDDILVVINELVSATRPNNQVTPSELVEKVWFGVGPRAGLALISLAKVHAMMRGCSEVEWVDVVRMIKPTFRHRMRVVTDDLEQDRASDDVIDRLVAWYQETHHNRILGVA